MKAWHRYVTKNPKLNYKILIKNPLLICLLKAMYKVYTGLIANMSALQNVFKFS